MFFYPYLDALDSEVRRNALLEKVGRRLGVNAESLIADYRKAKSIASGQGQSAAQGGSRLPTAFVRMGEAGARTADLFFMTAVVLYPESFPRVKASISVDDLDDTRAQDLFLALEEASAHDAKETTSILSATNDDAAKRYVLAVAASGELDQGIEKVVGDGLRAVRARALERRRTRLIAEIGRVSQDGASLVMPGASSAENQESVKDLLKKKMQLDVEIARLKGEVDE
jgi:DNA primase